MAEGVGDGSKTNGRWIHTSLTLISSRRPISQYVVITPFPYNVDIMQIRRCRSRQESVFHGTTYGTHYKIWGHAPNHTRVPALFQLAGQYVMHTVFYDGNQSADIPPNLFHDNKVHRDLFILRYNHFSLSRCFDAVSWKTEMASGMYKNSVLVVVVIRPDLCTFYSCGCHNRHLHHRMLQQNPGWLDILVLAYSGGLGYWLLQRA